MDKPCNMKTNMSWCVLTMRFEITLSMMHVEGFTISWLNIAKKGDLDWYWIIRLVHIEPPEPTRFDKSPAHGTCLFLQPTVYSGRSFYEVECTSSIQIGASRGSIIALPALCSFFGKNHPITSPFALRANPSVCLQALPCPNKPKHWNLHGLRHCICTQWEQFPGSLSAGPALSD